MFGLAFFSRFSYLITDPSQFNLPKVNLVTIGQNWVRIDFGYKQAENRKRIDNQ